MEFSIKPYIEIDGVRNIPDSVIKALWDKTCEDGLDAIVFYERTISNADQFLAMAKGAAAFYVLFDGGLIVGYTWLNRVENFSARQHFCVFKDYHGKSLDLGRFVLDHLMNEKTPDGGYMLGVLTGIVPEWNKPAINFALKCGGKTYGVIPNYIKEGEGAMLIYYTRGES